MVWKSLEAAQLLESQGIQAEVINMHTIKPLDVDPILQSIKKTKCVVTAEEHMRNGGLGDAVAQVVSTHYPVPQAYVAVNDSFGESGTPDELMRKYGLEKENIVQAVQAVIQRK